MKQKFLFTLVLWLSLVGSIWAQTATAPNVGDGSSTNPYQIATAENLYWLSQTSSVWTKAYYYKQTADIDLISITNWTAIGTDAIRFSGNYDGNNNAISNLTINASTNNQGLFGSIAEGSVIQNLTLQKPVIVTTANYAGIVAAINRGQIINCHTKSGSITGVGYVGGICAIVSGTGSKIERCYNSSTVTATGQYVGGIVAQAQNATIEQCSNTSPIKSTLATIGSADIGGIVGNVPDLGSVHTTINNCYNASSVTTTRGNSAGGIIGSGSGITMNNCYSLDGIIANSQAGGLLGLAGTRNTFSNCFTLQFTVIGLNETLVTRNNVKQVSPAQLATQSTFTNWDFAGETANGTKDIWLCSPSSEGYPAFAEQLLAASFISESSGTLTFPILGGNNAYVLVDWGDGTQEKKLIASAINLSHQYVKGNVMKIYANTTIGRFQATSQGLTSLSLGRHTAINILYCNNNNISQLTTDYNPAVKQIYCYNNKLSIATLPRPRSSYTTYTYTPQQQLAATCTNGVVDLSSQRTAIDATGSPQTTIYAWYLANGTALTSGIDYIENNGVFKFIKMPASTVYCTMSNAAFPNFTGSDILRTTNITIDAIAPINWTGATSTEWNTVSNWSEGVIPTADNNVVIPKVTNLPVISTYTPASCNNLTINDDASLTIAASATGTGSLIVHGTSTGKAVVQSYLTANLWHVVSSPVASQNISTFLTTNSSVLSNKLVNSTTYYGMMDYNESSNTWNSGTSGTTTGNYFTLATSGTLGTAAGYGVKASTAATVTYTGTLNSGNKTIALTRSGYGWNCIGNPYPSAIDINTNSSTSFLAVNKPNLDASYACIYVWEGSAYKIIGTVPTGFESLSGTNIAPGQCFFVKAKTDGTTVSFNTAMQLHANGLRVKSTKAPWPAIRLSVANSADTTSTLVAFNNSMSNGLDVSYDAGLLRGSKSINLYSHLVDDNGVDFAIQCLPEAYESLVIPVGVDCKAGGKVTFSAETADLPSTCKVILEDKASSTFTTLTAGTSYTATVDAGTTGTGRFFLHTSSATTGNNNGTTAVSDLTSTESLKVYAVRKVIYITGSNLAGSTAKLYNISGRGYGSYKITSDNTTTLDESALPAGVYVVHITQAEGKVKTFKVVME